MSSEPLLVPVKTGTALSRNSRMKSISGTHAIVGEDESERAVERAVETEAEESAEREARKHDESKLRRKVDLRLCSIAGILCSLNLLDSGIISSASVTTSVTLGQVDIVLKLYSMLKDLSLEGNRYVRAPFDHALHIKTWRKVTLKGTIRDSLSIRIALMADSRAMISRCQYSFLRLPV
jgi:hypothetical protein